MYYLTMLFSIAVMIISSLFSIQIITYAPSFIEENMETISEVDNPTYYRKSSFTPFEYENYSGEKCEIKNHNELYANTNNGVTYKTFEKGNDGLYHLLVLPITFKDSSKDISLEQKRINIHNAFFGSTEKNTSYSVSEYYNISSYGHVKMVGEVAPFFELDLNFDEVVRLNNQSSFVSRYLTDLCVNNYFDNHYDAEDKGNARYDFNDDGYIDGVFVIYDYPFKDTDSLNWAYVDDFPINSRTKINGQTLYLNHHSPYIKLYGWASYNFMDVNNYNDVNSHVYVHEVGHLFGLKDYYSNTSVIQPLGFLDMMDINIGDHNPYSKYILGWSNPYIIKKKGTIKIKPFATSGEFILIPSLNYNDNPFSEYFILEFYSPLGVNFYDTKLNFIYGEKQQFKGHMLNDYGIKVYHVDSSLGYYEKKMSQTLISSADNPELNAKLNEYRVRAEEEHLNKSWCIKIMRSNNENIYHPLIRIVERPGVDNVYPKGLAASNESLLRQGDTITSLKDSDFRFYDGSYMPFNFTINHIDFDGAEISFF